MLTAIDKNNNTYYLTTNDKIKVFDYLFLDENHYGDVKYKEICDLLDLAYFGPKNQKSQVKTFKQNYTLYKSITSICTALKLHSIIDLFSTKFQENQLKTIEEIVLNLNLYDEKKHKYQALTKMGISDGVKRLTFATAEVNPFMDDDWNQELKEILWIVRKICFKNIIK